MSAASEYADLFDLGGRRVSIVRPATDGATVQIDNVRVRIRGLDVAEVAGGVAIGIRKILVLAADVPTSFGPLEQHDAVVVDGLWLRFVERPDDQTHRDGETLLAYDGVAGGA